MTATWSTTPGLAEVRHETYAVVLNLPRIEDQQSPYVLEGTAFEIWRRIDGACTEEQIVEALVDALGVTREVAARDTRNFIESLRTLALVQRNVEP